VRATINADELSNAHIRQASEGLLAKVQNFDRDMEIQVANERVSNIESKILDLVGKKLRFKTTPDAANQSDFVKYNLMNLR